MQIEIRLRRCLGIGSLAALLACGSGGGHPDTGYGTGQAIPATVNCTDFCARLGDCGADLCNEDTMSTRYTGLTFLLVGQCKATCTDSQLQAKASASVWQCLFQSSCRQVFEHDACHVQPASYTCN